MRSTLAHHQAFCEFFLKSKSKILAFSSPFFAEYRSVPKLKEESVSAVPAGLDHQRQRRPDRTLPRGPGEALGHHPSPPQAACPLRRPDRRRHPLQSRGRRPVGSGHHAAGGV